MLGNVGGLRRNVHLCADLLAIQDSSVGRTPGGGGGGGAEYPTKFYTERLRPEVQTLTILYVLVPLSIRLYK